MLYAPITQIAQNLKSVPPDYDPTRSKNPKITSLILLSNLNNETFKEILLLDPSKAELLSIACKSLNGISFLQEKLNVLKEFRPFKIGALCRFTLTEKGGEILAKHYNEIQGF